MGNSEIIALTYDLKDKIISSDLYKDLKAKENNLFEDTVCVKLLNIFQELKSEYESAKRFEKYGSDVSSIQKRLSQVKFELDENELVKEYNLAYKKLKKELKNIEQLIFKDIIVKRKIIDIEKE